MEWLFDHVAPAPGARLLDVGCGSAAFWRANVDRIDPSWSLTLTDVSPGMTEAARAGLHERAEYLVADAQELPFADRSFDVVVANHMLYHVPDRPKALAEIARVLVPGGVFHAATNGRGHLQELSDLVGAGWSLNPHMEEFGLETGAAQLAKVLDDVRVERFDVELVVTEAEPVVAYIRSSVFFPDGSLERAREEVEAAVARDGSFRITTKPGLLTGRNP
jgi:SAM-dependent methyltransferase